MSLKERESQTQVPQGNMYSSFSVVLCCCLSEENEKCLIIKMIETTKKLPYSKIFILHYGWKSFSQLTQSYITLFSLMLYIFKIVKLLKMFVVCNSFEVESFIAAQLKFGIIGREHRKYRTLCCLSQLQKRYCACFVEMLS